MQTQYPNRIEATLLFDARFDALDAAVRDFARIAEMKSGDLYSVREHHPDTFARLHHSGDDLTLLFERRDGPPHADLCASALRSPITTILSPDMEHRVERARCHIRLEASHDALNATPDAFLRRMETLALMARVIGDHQNPSAVHWAQSDQVFESEAFEATAALGFPGPLAIHPILSGKPPEDIGLRTFGAHHWLGREIVVPPTALPWSAAYEAALAFCRLAASPEGYVIPDGDTFGPSPEDGEESGELWRVHHRQAGPSDTQAGTAPVYELVPLRHGACGFIAEDHALRARFACERQPVSEPHIEDDEVSHLAEMEAALAQGKAESAANATDAETAALTATHSLAGDPTVSGRSLRARVFGAREA